MRILALILSLTLAGCVTTPVVVATPTAPRPAPGPVVTRSPTQAAQSFVQVVEDVMPVARAACNARTQGVRCDYLVVVDDRMNQPPNAFQTLGRNNQPVVGFTLPLILSARNDDELAFILAHEAAHHIEGHIARGRASARSGALVAGALVAASGGDAIAVREAQDFGAFYGARRYAQGFELEADSLGAVLAEQAGYDAVRGIMFFQNAPDPGTRFLGTHPPNAQRIANVRRVVGR
ncbi:Protease HtpX [Rhodobacteraceae bacterium THAF1]|uniref:M48 family metallopeptidase n=1 Tax=Palleronia sp. THAF1 TaxID=2587842 RepID=UPI000F3E3D4D|nr:M48 family metallopeptidase [Palleronia sp. THAF1]QFU07367.1 Protease HtpX [Palleronia sp. THAF1]VDC20721.1 Protease HtpX [Rhodobacteraceae bacterium THAF1]